MNPTTAEPAPRQTPQGDTSLPGENAPPALTSMPARRKSQARRVHPATSPTSSTSARTSPAGSGARPAPIPRARHRGDALLDATLHLQPRDKALFTLLDEHRALTTAQIAAVLYDSYTGAQRRLYRLRRGDWLDRFSVVTATGRLDTHWVLGPLGSDWAAGEDNRPPPTPKAARQARRAIATSTHLEHDDGANQVFIDLLVHARHHPGTRLARWWSPARTAAGAGQRIHPDGHGVLEQADTTGTRAVQVGFYLEYDTGTETLGTLTDKIEPYRRLRQDGPDYPLLIWLPNPTRETNLHRRLNGQAAHLGITLATTTPVAVTAATTIAGPIWKVAGNGRPRHRLIDLPSRHGRPGTPYHPGAPTPRQDPLYRLG